MSTIANAPTVRDHEKTVAETMLELEEVDKDLYQSKKLWIPVGGKKAFGGNIIGLALRAATMTVSKEFQAHSLHSYFLLSAGPEAPVMFHVDRVRDVPRPNSPSHYAPMPDVPHHSVLKTNEEAMQSYMEDPSTPKSLARYFKVMLNEPIPHDFKFTNRQTFKDFMNPPASKQQCFWIRCKGQLGEDLALHQSVLAYESDVNLLDTTTVAYGGSWLSNVGPDPIIKTILSVDHSMWFHCPFRADEWMLYVCDSARYGSDRGLVFGRIYKEDGTLAVTVAQEGTIKLRDGSTTVVQSKL
ncbi:Acyl-CoA thioesterase 8 [Mortierella sp. AD094]|nr:Acyl-CoA thioesterase 8 [Mortierella sp. AD094]